MKILIFDTETSGTDQFLNVILQLSYQVVDSDSWETIKIGNFYFPWPEDESKVNLGAIQVNGLTKEVLESKGLSERKAALEEFVEDMNSCDLLVAHNLNFDKKFIVASCKNEGVECTESGWEHTYDTMRETTGFCKIPSDFDDYKWPRLTELAERLGIDYSQIPLHDSSGDVELTKQCFKKLAAIGFCNL